MIGSASTGLLLAAACYYGPHSLRYFGSHILEQHVVRRRALVLTYDDGPSSNLTPQLLDLLDSYRMKATFFVLGFRAMANQNVLDRMRREEHEIGCHGYAHLNAWKSWPWKLVSDMKAGYGAIAPWASCMAPYRPPYGRLSLPVVASAVYRHAPLGWWTIDSGDTNASLPDPQDSVNAVVRSGGGVVLMHDFDRQLERADYVLRTTELLLLAAQREGLTVCRFSDLLKPTIVTPQATISREAIIGN